MAIDKSLKQHYETQAGVKNFLGKQKMVKAPKYWLSKPGHVKAKLAYITDEEEQILIDKNLYGSLRGRPNKGPAGLPSLQGGDFGSGSGSPGGGNGSHDRGGWQHHKAATKPRQTVKAAPPPPPQDRQDRARETRIEEKAKKPPMLGDTGGSLVPRDKEVEPKKDILPEFEKVRKKEIIGGNPFLEDPYEKKIVFDNRDPNYEKLMGHRTYDPKTDPNALLDRGTGIGGILKGAAMALIPGLLPAKLASAYQMYNTAKTVSKYANKYGLAKEDYVLGFQNKVLDKDIRRQVSKDDVPKVADRHPGTGKKTTEAREGDGINRVLPESLHSDVSKGAKMFLSDEQREQYKTAQNKMKAALASGYYTDGEGKQVKLNDEQVNALTQWVTKMDDMLVDPAKMAGGGRVDKALGGRSRDI